MYNRPTGTVTFLFSDIEGSTRLAREHPGEFETLRQRHHSILRSAMEKHRGYIFQIIGDAFCVAFHTAGEAVQAAGEAQDHLFHENWGETPIKVRMGIHTGKADVQDNGEYSGYLALSRVQRVMSAGYGGQTLLSQVTQELVRDELPESMFLVDLGEHRLKDLIRPEHIYQLNVNGLLVSFPPIKTLDLYRHNLPVQMTSFIGREKEMDEIKQAVTEHRLVTLIGPGGSGKTRLSMQVAADLLDKFTDGVWFIDLAPVSDPAFIPQAIADALGIRQAGASLLIDLLVNYVRHHNLMLVLDNCEHLIEACAQIADQLLKADPSLKIIATSREGLEIAGEKKFSVPPLSLASSIITSVSTLSQYEATRLFIDRALLAQSHFTVNNENAPAIAQICYRLDGIPLAIELAAARVKAMSPEQINTRLDDSFRLLTGGNRTALPRQQTLRATIDWSWGLLSEGERTLLRRLSIFAGGWTLEAAEVICSGDGLEEFEVLDLLTQLVNKSLVIWQDTQGEARYLLLETIRQYAHAWLLECQTTEEANHLLQRHAEFFTHFVEHAVSQIYSQAQQDWLKRLDAEQDNLRIALEWTVNSKSPLALRIARQYAEYLFWRSTFFAEGIRWLERALGANPETELELRIYGLAWTAFFADQIGQSEQAIKYAAAGLDLARQSQDRAALAFALFIRGVVSIETGDPQNAQACLEEALPLARASQSPFVLPGVLQYLGASYLDEAIEVARRLHSTFFEALGLWSLGHMAFLRNDFETARVNLSSALELARELQFKIIIAHAEEMVGRVRIIDADLAGAQSSLTESFALHQDMDSKPCLAHGLEAWARLALAHGESQRAARILGFIDEYMKNLAMNMIPEEQALYDQTLSRVEQQLGATTFQQEWTAGIKLDLGQAIELAMN